MSSAVPFTSDEAERAYIERRAAQYGLDPQAVLAVAAHEGVTLPAEIGDSGTSFGPWQLHAGGALPANIWAMGPSYSQQWANSPAGIDYALAGIRRSVGSATSGLAEVVAQILNFERPQGTTQGPHGPYEAAGSVGAAELAAAQATYSQGGGPGAAGTSAAELARVLPAGAGAGTQQSTGFALYASQTPPAGLPPPGTDVTIRTFQQNPTWMNNLTSDLLTGKISMAEANSWWPNLDVHSTPWYNDIPGVSSVTGAVSGFTSGLEGTLLRGVYILGGIALLGVGLFGIFMALTKSELGGVLKTLGGAPAAYAGAVAGERHAERRTVRRPQSSAPLREQPKRVQRRAGFTLDVDKPRPKRGEPGSSRLAQGDEVPF